MHKVFTIEDWRQYFPFKQIRKEQETAINFALDAFYNKSKKFCITEVGTGGGKSAIGVTIANYLNDHLAITTGFTPGSYVLTTQKILQEQYINDFHNNGIHSIKSSANYQCKYYQHQTCAESRRILGRMRKQLAGTEFAKCCGGVNCSYAYDKQAFINSQLSITNFSFFLAETKYVGKFEPRQCLVIDECHNINSELSRFIEIVFSEKFSKDTLKCKMPKEITQEFVFDWVKNSYKPALAKFIKGIEKAIEKNYVKNQENGMGELSKQYELLDKHICKVNRFIEIYSQENWIMNVAKPLEGKRGGLKFEFKPIEVSHYSQDLLFKFGQKVIMMSATVLNKDVFCRNLGIDQNDCEFISIDSPFPIENRPIHYLPIGKMSYKEIDNSLPKMTEILKEIMKQHVNDKGIFHTTNFKIANYIRDHIKDERLLIQNDENREAILKRHIESEEPTILVSPSMLEGVDLKDDLSRFQVFCKLPFPHLGDLVAQKKMERDPNWYPYVTILSIIQAAGRSIRNDKDHAQSYILDECWTQFYRQNRNLFPEIFRKTVHM